MLEQNNNKTTRTSRRWRRTFTLCTGNPATREDDIPEKFHFRAINYSVTRQANGEQGEEEAGVTVRRSIQWVSSRQRQRGGGKKVEAL